MQRSQGDGGPRKSHGTATSPILSSASWQDTVLQRGIEWLLGGLLLAPVIFMGVRYEWGWLAWGTPVLVGLASLVTLLWLIRLLVTPSLGFVFTWALLIPAMAGTLGVLQVVELPQEVLRFCSPGLESILPLWQGPEATASGWGPWRCASLAPARSIESLRILGLYCLMFFLVFQNVRTLPQVRRLLLSVTVIGSATAALGILQYIFWNGKFFWFFEIPWVPSENILRAPFTNRNHFSGYLAMTIGPALYWLLCSMGVFDKVRLGSGAKRDIVVPISLLTFVSIMAAAFLSLSRGGTIAATMAFLAAAAGLSTLSRSKQQCLYAVGVVCIAFVLAMWFAGTEKVQARLATIGLDSISDGSLSTGRAELWTALMRAIPDLAWLGSGLGSYRHVYALYYDSGPKIFTHAHNDYLELLMEGGIPMLLLALLGCGVLARWSFLAYTSNRSGVSACSIAVFASLLAVAFHGSVDFVWHLPSHALLISLLAGLAVSLCRLRRKNSEGHVVPAPRWLVGAGGICAAVVCSVWLQTSCARASWTASWREFGSLQREGGNAPDEPELEILLAASERQPDEPILHFRLAESYRRRFLESQAWKETPMPLRQIRGALAGSSASECEAWFASVYGEESLRLLQSSRHHYVSAVCKSPLLGRAYLRLSELYFLRDRESPTMESLVMQAVRCKPYDPELLYIAGADHFVEGREEEGMRCWKQAADVSPVCLRLILSRLRDTVPLAELVEFFQPDFKATLRLLGEYGTERDQSKSRLLLLNHAKNLTLQASDADQVGRRMKDLSDSFRRDNDLGQASECAKEAVLARPYVVSFRVALARLLIEQMLFDEAKEQLRICHLREPNNVRLSALRSKLFDLMQQARLSASDSRQTDEEPTTTK